MNHTKLDELGRAYGTDKSSLYHNFLDFYATEFAERNFSPQTVLEIGVQSGASIKMWRDYFPDATVWGMDIQEMQPIPGVKLIQADATDPLHTVRYFRRITFDLVIDDGSHKTRDQIDSFRYYGNKLSPGGIYIIEDLHTSFLDAYINTTMTTYEYLQKMPDLRGRYKIFQKDPEVFTDSMTAMIFKWK